MAYSTEDLRDLIIELDKKVERVIASVDSMKSKQEEITADLVKIKDPEIGLFARIKSLEEWRGVHSKITWTAITALIALTVKQFWDTITS